VLDLQTRKVTRSAISSEDFTVFPLWEFKAETLHAFRILVQEPPSPSLGIPRCHLW